MNEANDFSMYGYSDSREKIPFMDSLKNRYNYWKDVFDRYKPNQKNLPGYRIFRAGSATATGIYVLLGVANPLLFFVIGLGLVSIYLLSRKKKTKD